MMEKQTPSRPAKFTKGGFIVLITFMALLFFIYKQCGKPSIAQQSTQWYQGGTLTGATVAEWNAAAKENKLATCAEWTAIYNKANNVQIKDMDLWIAQCSSMQFIIDDYIKKGAGDSVKVSSLAFTAYQSMQKP